MTPLLAAFIYLIVWWTMLFIVLPWGNKRPHSHEVGMGAGAPANPNIKKKMIATTLLSFVVLAIVWVCMDMNIIDFREAAREMDTRIYGSRPVSN